MEKIILIKYGELTTKKANRKFFINTLTRNIEKILNGIDVTINKDRVRMYINCNQEDFDLVSERLSKVFGLHGIVIAYKVNNNI